MRPTGLPRDCFDNPIDPFWKASKTMIRQSFPALLLAGLAAGIAPAQEAKTKAAMPMREGAMSLALPTGDRATSSLMLEATTPARIAVGKAFDYQIKLTNLTKNLVLEEIVVTQALGEHFAVEKSEPESAKSDKKGEKTWNVASLAPGETKAIMVHALGDNVGSASSCIRVMYQPSLCVMTEFIKPEIQVSKEVPAEANLCDVIPARYVVKNTGTGAAKGVTLRDQLPDGLMTADGKKVVEANLGEIAQGQSKEVKVDLAAAKAGDYTSRATAKGEDDLNATSNQTTTTLRAAKLDIAITGPDAVYLGQASTYRVTVKNSGEAPAIGSKLVVKVDPDLRIDRVSKATSDKKAPEVGANNTLTWELGDLASGADSVVSFTGVGKGNDELEHTATASAVCARSRDLAATVTTATKTEVISLPALRLEMVDDHDPVKVGEDVTYTINVLNQGQGEDRNVKLVVKLPEGLTYVSSKGASTGKADGQTVTFAPVAQLAAKDQINYSIVAKATKAGDVRTEVDLTSDYLTSPNPEIEPTRLIEGAAAAEKK